MKLKVWCVSSDGRIAGYFLDYNEAFAYVENLVDPDDMLIIMRVEIYVSEKDFQFVKESE